MDGIARLRSFVSDMTRLVERSENDEPALRHDGRALLSTLVSADDWLPAAFAQPGPASYRQYLLWCDPLERFSVVSFVWRPGQSTPVHDHTVWGLVGMLRGAENTVGYESRGTGEPLAKTSQEILTPGAVGAVSPAIGDIHAVANALPDRVSVSIHVYGANIGAVARHTYDADTGNQTDFVSGYSNDRLPNLFERPGKFRTAIKASSRQPNRASTEGGRVSAPYVT